MESTALPRFSLRELLTAIALFCGSAALVRMALTCGDLHLHTSHNAGWLLILSACCFGAATMLLVRSVLVSFVAAMFVLLVSAAIATGTF